MEISTKNKAIKQLQMLSASEFKHFGKWLNSPWCNSNKNLIRFYKILKPYYPHFASNTQLTKEKLFKKLNPGKKFNLQLIYNLLSELLKQIEAFQLHEQLHQDRNQANYYALQLLLKKNQRAPFLKESITFIQNLEHKAVKDSLDFYQLAAVQEEMYRIYTNQEDYHKAYEALGKFDSAVDQLYLLWKSRFFLDGLEGELQFKDKYSFEDQLEYLNKINAGFQDTRFTIYQTYFKSRHLPLEQQFNKVEASFHQNFNFLDEKGQKALFSLLINLATRLIVRKGDISNYETAFQLYEIGVEKKLLLDYDCIPTTTFTNIVSTSNFLKKIEFSTKFIRDYSPFLNIDIREDAETWAKTHLAFHTADATQWELAKKLIQIKSYNNRFIFRTKILSIQMWIEDLIKQKENDTHFVLSNCKAFERQLDRNSVLPVRNKSSFKRLIFYIKKIINIIEAGRNKEKVLSLIAQAGDEQNLHAKTWVIQKAKEIRTIRKFS